MNNEARQQKLSDIRKEIEAKLPEEVSKNWKDYNSPEDFAVAGGFNSCLLQVKKILKEVLKE